MVEQRECRRCRESGEEVLRWMRWIHTPSRGPIVTCLHSQPLCDHCVSIRSLIHHFVLHEHSPSASARPRVPLSLSLYFSPFVFSWLSVRMITVPIRLGHASIVASARRVRSRTRARTCHRRCVVDKRGVEFERSREPKNVDNVVDSNGEKIAPR